MTPSAPEVPATGAVPGRFRLCDAVQGGLVLLLALAVAGLYSAYGSSSNTAVEPRSIFRWIAIQWRFADFRNNWIMLLVSAYAVYHQRHALAAARKRPSAAGMAVVLVSLALHVLGFRTQMPRLSLITVVGVGWGACYALWGWSVARLLLFPAGYTLLCFTGYHLTHFTMRLRLAASFMAEVLLQGVGIETVRKGTVLFSSAGGGFQLDVADACSGLRSLIVMTALAAPYAYFTQRGLWRKWGLFLLSVPLAMLANTIRIFTLALVAEWIGMRLAMALYHDFSGYLVFLISVALLMGAGSLLETDWRIRWRRFRQHAFSRT